jgi:MtN3 and saliva related transmembrane protein
MSQGFVDGLGLAAGALTTLAFVPQLLKIRATRSGRDVSMRTFLIFSTGVALWLAYGLLIDSFPIVLANVVTLLLALAIIALKIRYASRGAHGEGRAEQPPPSGTRAVVAADRPASISHDGVSAQSKPGVRV